MNMHINSRLKPEDESKLKDKLMHAETCPFHDIKPEIVGPMRKLTDSSVDVPNWQTDMVLRKMFPDALLFQDINWTCFCRKCAEHNPMPDKHNKFGYGFCSQYSWQAALRNWNSACLRSYKRIIKDNLDISRKDI